MSCPHTPLVNAHCYTCSGGDPIRDQLDAFARRLCTGQKCNDSGETDGDSRTAISEPLTSTDAPARRHPGPANRHGARAALTNKAQGLCRKGLHRKSGTGSCLRCQADRQRNHTTRVASAHL